VRIEPALNIADDLLGTVVKRLAATLQEISSTH
jgi:hypothetical protein